MSRTKGICNTAGQKRENSRKGAVEDRHPQPIADLHQEGVSPNIGKQGQGGGGNRYCHGNHTETFLISNPETTLLVDENVQ